MKQGSLSEELQKIVVKDYDSNISKAFINRALNWLSSSGIIGFAGKIINLQVLNFKAKSRCFFMDVGLANYFMLKAGFVHDAIRGTLYENFVYLNLRNRINHPAEIAFETPAFVTLGEREFDFFVKENIITIPIYA